MPLTFVDYPILARFLCAVGTTTGMPAQPLDAFRSAARTSTGDDNDATAQAHVAGDDAPKKLPKGVVLGPDGKPCRTCTSVSSWFAMAKGQTGSSSKAVEPVSASPTTAPSLTPRADCPPDIEALGRSSWTLLHSITGAYPTNPTPQLQADTSRFVRTFAQLYPCWTCADDFQRWLAEDGHAPRVSSRAEFGRWMCEAHNAVNDKLGKRAFDCDRWEERWRSGWKDGSCDP